MHGEAARAVAEQARVADALDVVSKALTHNATPPETLVQTLEQGKAQFDLPLDTSAWNAVKADVSGIVEPELRRRLAFHFRAAGSASRDQQHVPDLRGWHARQHEQCRRNKSRCLLAWPRPDVLKPRSWRERRRDPRPNFGEPGSDASIERLQPVASAVPSR